MSWYPSLWAPGVNGAGEYRPRGVPVSLVGGPLNGRQGHVWNVLEALYVADNGVQLVVRSTRAEPRLPRGYKSLGRYVMSATETALIWHGLEVAPDNPVAILRTRGGIWSRMRTAVRGLLGR